MEIPESVHTFGANIVNSNPTIYCYIFSDAEYWADDEMLSIVYLDDIIPTGARELSLEQDFRLAAGDVHPLVYNVFPASDNPTVNWTSSDPSVLTVEDGVITGLSTGTATVIATCGQASASVIVTVYRSTVNYSLVPSEAWILARTETCQLALANLDPPDAEIGLTYFSSDTSLATVDENGLVTSFKPGDVTITAVSEQGIIRTALIHLCYPAKSVELTAPKEWMLVSREMQLTATVTPRQGEILENHLVTFTSSDESIAAVTSESGLVRGMAPGVVTITAASANGYSSSVVLQVVDLSETMNMPTFPASLTTIEDEAFEGTPFEAVIIPDNVTSIGNRAFANCQNLVYVYIPASVTSIPADAFADCPNVIIDREGE